ncbi:DEAD/DEAH box helicase [Brucella pituitosa]|uniref:hypothetical protein n=1 Tax=Brucella pituitosa TaxID=571256 RepID=UPI000C2765C6|nr:hypothetical protein [Brucella pituitosa]PJO48110.1 hypothetical protein CWE02_10345 [Brucella pituitosa]
MSDKLKQHLANRTVEVLTPLLGKEFVELLHYVGQEALAPAVIAETIVTSRGAAALFEDPDIVALLIDHLSNEDAVHLCTALSQPTLMPKATLREVDFNRPNFKKTLFEWYGVPYSGPKDEQAEPSRRASSAWKMRAFQAPAYRRLRRALNQPSGKALVHMPFGAGKLRAVVTAVLEAFRSEEDGGNIFWLAPDECLAEEAVNELEAVWYQLGLRDLTTYTLFGSADIPLLDGLSNAVVVSHISSLVKGVDKWRLDDVDHVQVLRDFGASTKYVVLGDATQIDLDPVKAILEAMWAQSDFKLIGICGSPALAVEHSMARSALVAAFDGLIVEMDDDEPLVALRRAGETDPIEVLSIASPLMTLDGADDPVALPSDAAHVLSQHAERNKMLLDQLLALAPIEDRLVFYAATAMQARLFASMLSLKGKPAMALTDEMAPSQRSVEVTRFNTDEHMQVLCVHGTLVSSEKLDKITAVVLGKPIVSGAVLYEVVGRLASSRKRLASPVKIYAVRDPVPRYLNLVDNLASWNRLSAGD